MTPYEWFLVGAVLLFIASPLIDINLTVVICVAILAHLITIAYVI